MRIALQTQPAPHVQMPVPAAGAAAAPPQFAQAKQLFQHSLLLLQPEPGASLPTHQRALEAMHSARFGVALLTPLRGHPDRGVAGAATLAGDTGFRAAQQLELFTKATPQPNLIAGARANLLMAISLLHI